jgi:alpha-N-acetylglucosamine transferase
VCWSIVVKEKSAVGSTFSRTFPSDRTPKATKDVNVRLIYSCKIPVNSTNEFRELLKLLRTIIIVALQLNFVYCVFKNFTVSGKEGKQLLQRENQMKQSSSEDTVAVHTMNRTPTSTDRTVSNPCRLAQVCNGSDTKIRRMQWIRH